MPALPQIFAQRSTSADTALYVRRTHCPDSATWASDPGGLTTGAEQGLANEMRVVISLKSAGEEYLKLFLLGMSAINQVVCHVNGR